MAEGAGTWARGMLKPNNIPTDAPIAAVTLGVVNVNPSGTDMKEPGRNSPSPLRAEPTTATERVLLQKDHRVADGWM